MGGLTSTDPLHKSSQLILNKDIYESGAVAVLLPPGIGAHPIVSQGCRPIDQPFTVTSSSNNVIYELAGRPAWDRLKELVQNSDKSTRELITRGLHIGLVIDEHLEKFEMGDFLIRTIIDVDRSNGTLTVGSEVPLGSTIQFQVRDPETASSELHNLNQSLEAESVLLFTCNGRGHRFFGHPNHDAECFANQLATTQVVGMFCGGELGPIGGRHFLHGFTASALLLGVKKIQ